MKDEIIVHAIIYGFFILDGSIMYVVFGW